MKKLIIFLTGCVCFIALILSIEIFLYFLHAYNTTKTFEYLRSNIKVLLTKSSAAAVLESINELTSSHKINYDECHTLMHLAGHEIYPLHKNDIEFVVSLSSGSECLGGYLHGVEAEIIIENSVDDGLLITDATRAKLHAVCTLAKLKKVNNGPCFHGVGHALMELTHNIQKSLMLCDSLQDIELPASCYRGAFSQLNNLITGFDGSSHIIVPGFLYPGFDWDNPYLFCQALEEKYRDSCFSQFSMLFYISKNPESSFANCIKPYHTEHMNAICVQTLAGVYARIVLRESRILFLPEIINTMPQYLQKAAILGFYETLTLQNKYEQNNFAVTWENFCKSFLSTETKKVCIDHHKK